MPKVGAKRITFVTKVHVFVTKGQKFMFQNMAQKDKSSTKDFET